MGYPSGLFYWLILNSNRFMPKLKSYFQTDFEVYSRRGTETSFLRIKARRGSDSLVIDLLHHAHQSKLLLYQEC